MGRPRRRGHGRGAPFTGEPNGFQPGDDVGNRRSFKQQQVPPDDLGNRRDLEEEAWVPNDDVGNRVDIAPTHEISGVLLELSGGRGRRRKKGQQHQRVGRYIVGGVNPVVAGNVQRTIEAMKEHDEKKQQERDAQRQGGGPRPPLPSENGVDEEGRRGRRRRRRRRDGREQVDGQAAQEVSERRAQRFFDFEEDDRFEYVLKSDREQKRKDAHDAVKSVLDGAGRDATVTSRVLDDENRPKVIVTIDDRGPSASLPEERRAESAKEPLFVLGNAALMSLNYLVNKIVNRYPDDRIRLAILPVADERLYLESLEEHRRQKRSDAAELQNGAAAKPAPAPEVAATSARAEREPDATVVDDETAEQPESGADAPQEAALAPAKPKKRATKVKITSTKKAAPLPEPDDEDEPEAEAEAVSAEDEPAGDTKARKATKKKASAKKATGTKKAVAKAAPKKAATKKAPAKKSGSKKKAASDG